MHFLHYFGRHGTYHQNTFVEYKKDLKNLHLNKNVKFVVTEEELLEASVDQSKHIEFL